MMRVWLFLVTVVMIKKKMMVRRIQLSASACTVLWLATLLKNTGTECIFIWDKCECQVEGLPTLGF